MTRSNVVRLGYPKCDMSTSMQELVGSLLAAEGQVIVIDDGALFRPQGEALDSTFIELSPASNICLNPFSIIDEETFESDSRYREEATQFLNLIIGQMCRGPGSTDSVEKALIGSAISEVWRQYKREANITNIAEFLLGRGPNERKAHNLGFALEPFSKGGSYAAFFEGQANLRLEASYCALNLDGMTTKRGAPCLAQRIVLMSVILLVSEKMWHGTGTKIISLIVNKALECSGDEHLKDFIYKASRRPRKNNGIFMSGIPSVDNFYQNKAAMTMLMNASLIKARRND